MRLPAMPQRCSVVVPVYNSQDIVAALLTELDRVLSDLGQPFEVVLVNDGSRDSSWERICREAQRREWVRGLNLTRNFGQHNALLCGIRAARYDVIITLDDDLQNPPAEIPRLLAKLAEGYDVVYGSPAQERHVLWRNLASRITKISLQAAMGAKTARHVSAFRAFRTRVRDAFASYRGPYVSIDVLLTWGTTRFAWIPVRQDPRRAGLSQYTFGKLLTHALNMMTGFSTWPLRLASLVGFAFTLFGLSVLGFVLGRYFISGGSVAGFPFLASVIAIFSGAQLFSMGIIGEYLARMHSRMMERPTYAVGESTSGGDD